MDAPTFTRPYIRETGKYPKVTVSAKWYVDSCLNPSTAFEHVLACAHISTEKSNEPTVSPDKGKGRAAEKTEKTFYCDACAGDYNEWRIHINISSTEAGKENVVVQHLRRPHAGAVCTKTQRTAKRNEEAHLRGKDTNFRKCYIAQKTTSVPCDSNGRITIRYVPKENAHPSITGRPQIGDNMFDDIDTNPEEDPEPSIEKAQDATELPGNRNAGSSSATLGEAGANYQLLDPDEEATRAKKPPIVSRKKRTPTVGPTVRSHTRTNVARSVIPSSSQAAPVISPRCVRKWPVVDGSEDEYEDEDEDEDEEEEEVVKRSAN
ncbi:hypothetical protein EJ02DRAFT_507897 [Clathrospora elynae]|uniref:Uncharacterized protein n=1 Tax=Clathrospora elynae TaxID=706981 RepID=A0A6A5T5L9_9PLEO|nr:hypothetical protein EJ02DRAFT_507897 [Clathrospora elynae]